jgi:aryl-alcohol dehydrogenase-like predicted oxidoreductase
MERRRFLEGTAAAAAVALTASASAAGGKKKKGMLTRKIPRSGESIPVIGLGTSRTFDVGPAASDLAPLVEVMRAFIDAGGRVIDSSPMYGQAERVVGDLLERTGNVGKAWLATKVWTDGEQEGIEQMNESFRLMRTGTIDLMQVHNLVDTQTHLKTLRKWKEKGRIRHIGITHMRPKAYPEMERLMKKEKLDFVQLPYSIGDRQAEERLLPCARHTGTAVLVMRPFEKGRLFQMVGGKPLPGYAKELQASSWAQLFLKWLLGHPAVTCPIPATSKLKHALDNVQGGFGPLPDAKLRRRIQADVLG